MKMKNNSLSFSQRRAAAYIRVSTHGKQEELSPDSQKKLLFDYANTHHYTIAPCHIFQDSGISGRKAEKRPEFKRMIALAKSEEHPFDAILVWKFSRFARNQEESIVYKSMLQKQQVEVISISEPIADNPFGILIERIIEWMDEYYSIRLSGDVMRGMKEKAERGGYLSIPPFGYERQKGQSIPTVHRSQALVVQSIFRQYLEGFRPADIARHLNQIEIKTRTGALWESRSIEYILKNPFYIGKIRWNRQEHETHRIKEESEWIIRDALHPPILSENTFYAVQEKMKKDSSPARRRCISSSRHWLSGLLCCSYCKKRLAYSPGYNKRTQKSYPYFQCYQYGKGKCPESHALSVLKAETAFFKGLEPMIQNNGCCYVKKDSDLLQNKPAALLSDTQLDILSQKEIRAKTAYLEGIDTLQQYKENKKELEQERKNLLKYAESVLSADSNLFIQKTEELLWYLKNPKTPKEQKSAMVRSVIEKIIYDKKNDSMEFHFYLP